jgi:surface antigen/LysM repeat protein
MQFVPRLTAPSKDDKRYINHKKGGYNTCIMINTTTGSVIPNCVGYAQGRLLEILGQSKVNWNLPACNAEDWYNKARELGFMTGQTPKLGAIACWRAGKLKNSADGAGHVAVVEEIKSNGDIVISQSAYGGSEFYTSTLTKASGYTYSSNRPLMGFIYCGIEFEKPVTPSSPPANNIVAGKQVVLNNTPCYTSESAKTSYGKKSGTFYLWDAEVRNGRIRITNSSARVGVSGQVTCWVALADLELAEEQPAPQPAPQPEYQCIHTVKKGETFWGLAVKYLGKGSRYPEIMEMNGLDGTVLYADMQLKIPNK